MTKLRFAGRMAVWTGLIALSAPAIEWILNPHEALVEYARVYGYSLIYTMCVGWPMLAGLPRLWPLTHKLPAAARWLLRSAALVIATCTGCALAGLFFLMVVPHYHFIPGFLSAFRISLVVATVVTIFTAFENEARGRVRSSQLALQKNELERERALKMASEARLASLQSRVHPHFLFNAINSVSSLIADDPVRAERLLGQIADLLRFSLDSPQSGLVPLDRELHIVQEYLEIEQARFGARLEYAIDVPEEVRRVRVPPLSLQSLAENVIKHVVSNRRVTTHLRVLGRACANGTRFEVWDDGPGFRADDLPVGHGLESLRERLRSLCGTAATLDVVPEPGGTTVSFLIP